MATVVVLALLAIIGLLSASTLHDVLFSQLLASGRQHQQRAFAFAELGIAGATDQLARTPPRADYTTTVHIDPAEAEYAVVTVRSVGTTTLPAGFSAGRFITRHYEIESTGRSLRNARAMQMQGISRVLLVASEQAPP